jgi:uncharacterized membrane protein (DUF2068 family)
MAANNELLRRPAPTLYGIIAFKLIKGALFVALAIMAYTLSDNDLPEEYRRLMDFLRIHPGNKFFSNLAEKVGRLTEVKLLVAAAGTLVYSLFALIEGVGMIFRANWAGWLAIGESAFFIPIEIYELSRKDHPSWYVLAILIINVIIVWYLYKNRLRLFRHHHHAPSPEKPSPHG